MNSIRLFVALLLSLAFVACAAPADPEASAPPILGSADGGDRADHACSVVLRALNQPFGLPTNYQDGRNWVVFEGTIDVADSVPSEAEVAVVYTGQTLHGTWLEVGATPAATSPSGFRRYTFTLDRFTVEGGDNTAWRNMRIEVAPFIRLADGARVFDHNRNPGDFDNYVLSASQSRIDEDAAVCALGPEDRADTECQLVLRTLAQPFGLPTHRDAHGTWVVWAGAVDVDAAFASDVVSVGALYSSSATGGAWLEVAATRVAAETEGFDRYSFTLESRTVAPGDNTAWRNMRIEIAPFVVLSSGDRVFDHNRNVEPFSNYTLTAHASRIDDDTSVCY